jgi:hypothetical protein
MPQFFFLEVTMPKPKVSVAFCRLDARDDSYTGYSTTGFYDFKKDKPITLTKELGMLSIFLEREYLTRVRALQDELDTKYSNMAAELTTATLQDENDYCCGLSEEAYEAARKVAEEAFPGDEADYYT